MSAKKNKTRAAETSTQQMKDNEPAPIVPGSVYPIKEVSDIDIAFPASVRHLMPAYADLPKDFDDRDRWESLAARWFFEGLREGTTFSPKEGVDAAKALRHIRCILGSFEPKHEHKTLGVAWLLSQWFHRVEPA